MSWWVGYYSIAPNTSMRIEYLFPSGIYSPDLGRQTGDPRGPQFALAFPYPSSAYFYGELRTEGHDVASSVVRDEFGDWTYDWIYRFTVTNIGPLWVTFSLHGGGVT